MHVCVARRARAGVRALLSTAKVLYIRHVGQVGMGYEGRKEGRKNYNIMMTTNEEPLAL
jgi:hypothetical protein